MRPLAYLLIICLAACECPVYSGHAGLRDYSQQEQDAMADAAKYPVCRPLWNAVKDCQVLRDEVRTAH